MSAQRVAVIGDIGGHHKELLTALVDLGADPEKATLPPDLAVVQVGDLLHRGPDSPGVIALVDEIMARQPDQWVQLVGNHEAQYLTEQPRFEWDELLDPNTVATVQRWWRAGQMQLAAAIGSAEGDWLVTHAGLTRGFWHRFLGRPSSAATAATALNSLIRTSSAKVMFRGGLMITGKPDHSAGPIWAAAGDELAVSWLDGPDEPPFHQVHGHSTIVDWNHRRWQAPPRVTELAAVDHEARHSAIKVGQRWQVSIDPAFGKIAHSSWKPFLIPGGHLLR